MKLVYIAGPYRAMSENQVLLNIIQARSYALKYWRLGFAVICPHLNSAFMGEGPNTDDKFLEGGLELVRRCDVVVMIPGWKQSRGALTEHELARALSKQIIYEEPK